MKQQAPDNQTSDKSVQFSWSSTWVGSCQMLVNCGTSINKSLSPIARWHKKFCTFAHSRRDHKFFKSITTGWHITNVLITTKSIHSTKNNKLVDKVFGIVPVRNYFRTRAFHEHLSVLMHISVSMMYLRVYQRLLTMAFLVCVFNRSRWVSSLNRPATVGFRLRSKSVSVTALTSPSGIFLAKQRQQTVHFKHISSVNIRRNFLPTRQYMRKLMAEFNVSRALAAMFG